MATRKAPSTKLRKDAAEVAFEVVQAAIGEGPRPEPPGVREKNPEAVRRGAKGGAKGGYARGMKLSQSRLHKSAKKAAKARWQRKK